METFEMLKLAYVGSAVPHATVFRWYNFFEEESKWFEDEAPSCELQVDRRTNRNTKNHSIAHHYERLNEWKAARTIRSTEKRQRVFQK